MGTTPPSILRQCVKDERITYAESLQLFLLLFCGTPLFCKLVCDVTVKNIAKEFEKLREENPEPWPFTFLPFMRRLCRIVTDDKRDSTALTSNMAVTFFKSLFPYMLHSSTLHMVFFLYEKCANKPFGFLTEETLDDTFTYWEQGMLDLSVETIVKRAKR